MFIPPPPSESQSTSRQQPSDEIDLHAYAAQKFDQGYKAAEVRELLVEQHGVSAEQARNIVAEVRTVGGSAGQAYVSPNAMRELGQRNMLFGALWCIGGILVTAITLGAASGSRGGTYVVAWGAILFGGIQFMRGLAQMSSGSNSR